MYRLLFIYRRLDPKSVPLPETTAVVGKDQFCSFEGQRILAQVDLFSPKWITCFSTLTKFWKHSWKWKRWHLRKRFRLPLTNINQRSSRSLQKPSEEQESRPCDENKDSNSSTAHFLPFLSLPPTFSQAHVNCLIHSEKRLEKSNFLTFLTKTSG